MDVGSTTNVSDGNVDRKKENKLKRKRKKNKATVGHELQSTHQIEMDEQKKATNEDESQMKMVVGKMAHGVDEIRMDEEEKATTTKDEVQSMDQQKMDEGMKVGTKDEVQITDQMKMFESSNEILIEGNADGKKKKKPRRKKKKVTTKDESQMKMEVGKKALSVDETRMGEEEKATTTKDEVQSTDQRKMDEGMKAATKDEVQSIDQRKMDEGMNAATKDEVQITDQMKMFEGSSENLSEHRMEATKDEVQITDQMKMFEGSSENLSEGNADGKKKKKLRRKKKKVTIKDESQMKMEVGKKAHSVDKTRMGEEKKAITKDEVQSIDQQEMDEGMKVATKDEVQITDQMKLFEGSSKNLSEGNTNGKKKKKLRRKKKKITITDESQMKMEVGKKAHSADESRMGEEKKAITTKDEVQSIDQQKMDEGIEAATKDEVHVTDRMKMFECSNENLTEGNADGKKKKRKRKKKKKVTINDDVQGIDQTTMDEAKKATIKGESQNVDQTKLDEVNKATIKDEVQSICKSKMDEVPAEIVGGNVTEKSGRKRKRTKKTKIKDEVQSMSQTKMGTGSNENLSEGKLTIGNTSIKDKAQNMDQAKMDTVPTGDVTEGNMTGKRKKKQKSRKKVKTEGEFQIVSQGGSMSNLHLSDENCMKIYSNQGSDCINNWGPSDSKQISNPNLPATQKGKSEHGLSEVSDEIMVDEVKGYDEERSLFSTCNAMVITKFSSYGMKDVKDLYPKIAPSASVRRKLLVLDINGLIADIIRRPPRHCRGDTLISRRAVFRRPFFDDFLKFCFHNFDVAIWSSRSKKIIDEVVSYLLGDQKSKLLFCWDMSYTTPTGFNTLQSRHKPLVCKELRQIWQLDCPHLPWKKGDYDESNTLLLDDSPYKALLNPLHTAIFPNPYRYFHKNDDSLGPKGDLRIYLEGLATCENVQKYVEQHPFGQRPITKENLSWEFYSRVLDRMAGPFKDKTLSPVLTIS